MELNSEQGKRIMAGLKKIAQLMSKLVEDIRRAFVEFTRYFEVQRSGIARVNQSSWQKFNRPVTERRRDV